MRPSDPETASAQASSRGGEASGSAARVLGEFRLLRRLGRGGMAEVWLAEQTTLSRKVALKLLRAELMEDEAYVSRFKREASAAGGLNHPNIVQVHMIGEEGGQHYIAQEYVRGVTLNDYLKKKGPPDLPFALHVMRQVAAALKAAADAGIVHRDIKPENIMITRTGEVKVADFGLARLQEAGLEGTHITQEGVTMGTPLYMSPEQVQGGPLDPRSDIYSFGVTCYHMLAGKPPFDGPTAVAVAVKHLQEEPPPIIEARPDLPPAVCEIVAKMMAKLPEKRYASAAEVAADVRKVMKALRTAETPTEFDLQSLEAPVAAEAPPAEPAPPARPLAMILTLLMGAAAAGAGAGWLARPRNPFNTPPAQASEIRRMDSARAQYVHALFLGDNEDAWRAVIDGWSEQEDRVWIRQAQEQLALHYLRSPGRESAAEGMLDTLETYKREHPKYGQEALAGRAYLLARRGQHQRSRNILQSQLDAQTSDLPPAWQELVDDARAINQQHLDRLRSGAGAE